jgi:hypothetical protein
MEEDVLEIEAIKKLSKFTRKTAHAAKRAIATKKAVNG